MGNPKLVPKDRLRTALDVAVFTLADSLGNDMAATTVSGTVTIR